MDSEGLTGLLDIHGGVVFRWRRVLGDVLTESFTPVRIELDLIDKSLKSSFRRTELGKASSPLDRTRLARKSQVAGIVVQRCKVA